MKSINIKKYLIFLIVIMMIVISIVSVVYLKYKESYITNVEEDLHKSSIEYANFISYQINLIKASIENLEIILNDKEHFFNNDDVSKIFKNVKKNMPIISSIYFVNESDGNGINSDGILIREDIGHDLRKRLWYVKASKTDEIIVTPVYDDIRKNKPVITIAYRIKKNDQLIGVIGIDMFLDDIHKTIGLITSKDSTKRFLIDENGRIIMHPLKFARGLSLIFPNKQQLNNLNINENIFLKNYKYNLSEKINRYESGNLSFTNLKNKNVIGYFKKLPELNWTLVCQIEYDYIKESLNDFLFRVVTLGLIFIFILGVLLYYFLSDAFNVDNITGTFSKNKLIERLNKHYMKNKDKILLYIDIYSFSVINDNYGRRFGDKVLKEIAKILKEKLLDDGILAHSRADDFMFLFNSDDWSYALSKTEYLRKELEKLVIKLDGKQIDVDLFFGLTKLARKPKDEWDASIALVEELFTGLKNSSDNGFLVYCDFNDLIKIKENKEKLKSDLIKAFNEDKIVPFFQPIFDIKSENKYKYEILMRIKDGENYISPFPYIKIAEENNLIEKIDLRVIEKALIYKKSIDHSDKLMFSINVSGRSLMDLDFLNKVKELIDKFNINYNNIIFEITETHNINNIEDLVKLVKHFKDLGFKFAIDDFGTGYSSMYYLKCIPADFVKIDGSFVRDLNINKESYYLVESIVKMAKAFNMKVIAEYVENQEVLDKLNEIGVDYAQGYFTGKPEKVISI